MYASQIGDIRPSSIIERSMPVDIKVLPTVVLGGRSTLEGLTAIVSYYEKSTGCYGLVEKSDKFAKANPDYRITDKATHKNLVF